MPKDGWEASMSVREDENGRTATDRELDEEENEQIRYDMAWDAAYSAGVIV
jgi:hypothetical protein